MSNKKELKLNPKQLLFVYHYLNCWNATKAALLAGYAKKSAHSQAFDLLRKPEIESYIASYIEEKAMPANEVLARLADMARGSIDDVIDADDEFDLTLARSTGKMHLVKKLKRTERTDKDGNTTRTTEVELYDAQAALVHIGKHLGLFREVLEIQDWRKEAEANGIDAEKLYSEFVEAAKRATGAAPLDAGGDVRSDSGDEAGE